MTEFFFSNNSTSLKHSQWYTKSNTLHSFKYQKKPLYLYYTGYTIQHRFRQEVVFQLCYSILTKIVPCLPIWLYCTNVAQVELVAWFLTRTDYPNPAQIELLLAWSYYLKSVRAELVACLRDLQYQPNSAPAEIVLCLLDCVYYPNPAYTELIACRLVWLTQKFTSSLAILSQVSTS